jgi:transposase
MSEQNYITEMLELKDKNIKFFENCYYKEKIDEVIHKIFEGYLTYQPSHCYKCGVAFDSKFEKHGFISSDIVVPDVAGYKTILRLHKQRYLCKHCNKTFT